MRLFGFATAKAPDSSSQSCSEQSLLVPDPDAESDWLEEDIHLEASEVSGDSASITTTSDDVSDGSNSNSGNNSYDKMHDHDLARTRLGSFAPECNALKKAYDACFLDYFSRWVKGSNGETEGLIGEEDPCSDKLRLYTACVRKAVETYTGVTLSELDGSRIDMDELMVHIDQNSK
ncbi:unnamed protein product [Protopolystoma xenopodis]|uniref:Uncharacterized protein n=1 Tax=Protopolystoma xenopodis TaxID=117903 RepID=A0A448WYX7_9PLAT|nr:unnamed protein product [Protopolystoma xenopodis]